MGAVWRHDRERLRTNVAFRNTDGTGGTCRRLRKGRQVRSLSRLRAGLGWGAPTHAAARGSIPHPPRSSSVSTSPASGRGQAVLGDLRGLTKAPRERNLAKDKEGLT